ncbi:hypothetical protein [Phytohabitans houttuyneae]|uniref:Uncharacterized protein n=1 Tax=Phytohabitans houttuyneae TaxID=1076126 RepID=A0A6V8JWX4_9ACTN|nr:hypothetical protein [Phytohabitans houttuyneae]GFJ77213.1 hypothetical protein Phou_013930 [Phytohabitans houttuyneae]
MVAAPSDHVATPTAASVHGRPGWLTPLDAEGRSHEPRWSPAEGMEASVLGDGLTAADTLAVAEAVRFDRRARCLTPVRVTALPPGAKLISCGLSPSVVYEPEWQPGVMLRFVDGTSGIDLFLGGDPAAPLTFPEDLVPMEGGRTAWAARAKTLVVYDLGGVRARVSVRGRYGRAEAELIADGLVRVPGAERERPATWSASLTGSP